MIDLFLGMDPADSSAKWSEDMIQMFVVSKLRKDGYLVHADGNGANKAKSVAVRQKALGSLAGWSDLTVISNKGDGAVFWFELKTYKGILSDVQKELHKEFLKRGHVVHVIRARTPMDALNQIKKILGY